MARFERLQVGRYALIAHLNFVLAVPKIALQRQK
jgi:hypothetical protein